MKFFLDFESEIAELEARINDTIPSNFVVPKLKIIQYRNDE